MIVTIPTIKREMVDGDIKVAKGQMKLVVDTSFRAHLKWEENFQKTLGCDLNTYVARVSKMFEKQNVGNAEMLSALKMLYCFVDSKELPCFSDFLQLFDFEIADEVLNEIGKVLEEVSKSVVTEKN